VATVEIRSTEVRRPFFEAFIAVLCALALVFGLYAFGRAMNDDSSSSSSTEVNATATESQAADANTPAAAPAAGDAAAHSHDGAATAAVDDRGFAALSNGEQHGHEFTQAIDTATRVELGRQLSLARDFALKYPTVKDAEAAGWLRAGPFSPGLGSHHINPNPAAGLNGDGVVDDNDIQQPLALMYDGVQPDSHVAGLFYGAFTKDAPEGFAGPNDIWHKHKNICTVARPGGGTDTPLGADRDSVTKEQCDAVGGQLLTTTPWLLHVWVVPGYESPEGVFAHLSSGITCTDGTYHTIGLESQIGNVSDICLDANS
jgi:hypothetical protein